MWKSSATRIASGTRGGTEQSASCKQHGSGAQDRKAGGSCTSGCSQRRTGMIRIELGKGAGAKGGDRPLSEEIRRLCRRDPQARLPEAGDRQLVVAREGSKAVALGPRRRG